MIIGNGLMANIFKLIDSNSLLIFASGVSNSMEDNDKEYKREFDLIKLNSNTNKKFIYFSTIDINNDRKYFLHKKQIEEFISNNFQNYLIFRLPNIIGNGGNKNNIFNYFIKNITENNLIKVQDVYKSLIDIDDILNICQYCMESNNCIINIASIEQIKVIDIINILSEELNIKPTIEEIKTNNIYTTIKNSSVVEDSFIYLNIIKENYTKNIIKKYTKKYNLHRMSFFHSSRV